MVEKATIVVQSGDIDKLYSALIIGNGALAMGMEVTMFFTFWGLLRLKKGGLEKGKFSRMNMGGLGTMMIKKKMKAKNVASLSRLMEDYIELGGRAIACDMTMDIMGVSEDDLDPRFVSECGGVGTYINDAKDAKITLFI